MTQYIYPAVLTYDKESGVYLLSIYDLDLYTEGSTVEEAYNRGKAYLENYIACAINFGMEITPPSTFEEIEVKYGGDRILMIESSPDTIKNKNI